MKKTFIFITLIFIGTFLWSQNIEIIKKIPFGTEESFNYWTGWDANEGCRPGISNLLSVDESFYVTTRADSYGNLKIYSVQKNVNKEIESDKLPWNVGEFIYSYINNGCIFGWKGSSERKDNVNLFINYKNKTYNINFNNSEFCYNELYSDASVYITDNTAFFMTYSKELISIQLFENGTYKARDVEETKAYLKNGKAEELGIDFRLNKKGKVSRICIGDYSLNRSNDGINYWNKRTGTFKIMNSKYEDKKNLTDFEGDTLASVYELKGYDTKGLHYFLRFDGENGIYNEDRTDLNVKFSIVVLDPWEDKIYFYEDYKVNEWNPPRDSNGKVICSTSWTVAPDGNIYYTDCDVANKEWLIKKIPNRWYEEIGINKRHIGTFTKNHIPLYLEPSERAETDGFNFENDIVWEKETKGEWSKIQKLDGREGWVETKYINFDNQDSVPQTNVAVSKVMTCSDNLRLRSQEATSSSVITTMKKGTKVKILKLGKAETIDGINSNWVQIEVLSGAKDKDGKEIKSGTTGWCYGGYLE